MYRERDVQNCLFGLVGFRQNNNPDYPTISELLTESATGLYFQDEHPLICIEYLDQALKNYNNFAYPDYNAATTYIIGDRIKAVDGKIYLSKINANLNNDPTISPVAWEIVSLFSQKLEQLIKSSINKVISAITIQKKFAKVAKTIFESTFLFDGVGSVNDKEIKNSRFVGLEITVSEHRDIVAVIKRLGTQFSAPNPNFKLYVFHSSKWDAPFTIIDLNLVKSNSFEWSTITDELLLKYLDENLAPGGSFYIGYYEDDLIGQAINRGYDFDIAPTCSTCNYNYLYYERWHNYISIRPFNVASTNLVGILPSDPDGPKLWDIYYNKYESSKNYGLNLDITVRCDLTEYVCAEKHLFADTILKQVTVDVLNILAYSTRNNVIAKEVRDLAMYELNNKDNYTPGAVKRLEKSLEALSFDLSGINKTCLSCNNHNPISWGRI